MSDLLYFIIRVGLAFTSSVSTGRDSLDFCSCSGSKLKADREVDHLTLFDPRDPFMGGK